MNHYRYRNIMIILPWISLLLFAGCGDSSNSNGLPASRLQRIIDQEVADGKIPGAILGVQAPIDTWLGAAGTADTATAAPMMPDMQVRLASVTKPFTAVLAMKLVEDGVLSLDDTVEKWLPGEVPDGRKMTLRMLLNHSAGIFDVTGRTSFWEAVYSDPYRAWLNQDILALSTPYTPVFPPGSQYSYSNTGYYVAGMVMESAMGTGVSSLFQEKIAGPAQLTRTTLTRQGALEKPFANGYAWVFTRKVVEATGDWNFSWDWTAGAGVSTAADMLGFADALFKGRILHPQTVALMTSPESFAPGSSYGLGLGVLSGDDPGNPFGVTLIGWSGENPGTATQWYHLPHYDTTIFVAVNRNDIPEGPGKEPPVDGGAASFNVFTKTWNTIKPFLHAVN